MIKVYTVLQGLFKMAYLADLIDRNPMDKVQRPRPRKDEVKTQEAEAYTAEEIRHSFASIAITNGADIASVSEKLGHTDKAVTLRMYTHADQESIKRASQIFRDAIKEA